MQLFTWKSPNLESISIPIPVASLEQKQYKIPQEIFLAELVVVLLFCSISEYL